MPVGGCQLTFIGVVPNFCRQLRVMSVRFLIVLSALMASASLVFGGAFQKTKDGKTSVWNDHPKEADVASWNGARDEEGYAKGFGTLTWTKEQGGKPVVYARYFGNMVRGKFEGGVNAHSNGKTSHAFFTKGMRTSPWAPGTAPLLGAPSEKIERSKTERAIASEESEPRTTPAAKRPVPDLNKLHQQTAATPSPAPMPQPTKPPTEETASVSSEAAPTPISSPAAEKIERPILAEPTAIPSTPPPVVAEKKEEPVPPKLEATATPPPSLAPSPTAAMVAQKEEALPQLSATASSTPPAIPTPRPRRSPPKATASKPKRAVDESLRALAGPPASLRKDTLGETKSDTGSSANPPLSKDEVADLADTVARTRGYNLGDFEHGQPEYKAEDDTWSVSYDQKAEDAASGSAKHFSVMVDGRTKKTTLVAPP